MFLSLLRAHRGHTSSQHEWFKESKSSKQNPKRDWFIWKKGKTDENGQRIPPNNWKSVFGAGPAWTYDEATDEWYLRLFVRQVRTISLFSFLSSRAHLANPFSNLI